jgi:hypothetical protein
MQGGGAEGQEEGERAIFLDPGNKKHLSSLGAKLVDYVR